MRYLVAILIAGILLLGFRVLFRRRVAQPQGAPVPRWPWALLVLGILLVAVVGFVLREWALPG